MTKRKKPEDEDANSLYVLGSRWFHGIGSKAPMQRYAANIDAQVQLQVTEPDTGYRGFICYKDWPTAIEALQPLARHRRHIFEIVKYGLPCKPHLDIECAVPKDQTAHSVLQPLGWTSPEHLIQDIQATTMRVFEEDYQLPLHEEDFVWIVTQNPLKLSYHLVVDTARRLGSSAVYRVNDNDDPQGASHLAKRLVEMAPQLQHVIDRGIYTRDREFRMLGSRKHPLNRDTGEWKDTYTCEALRPDLHGDQEACVTWLTEPLTVIDVPCVAPHQFKRRRARVRMREAAAEQAEDSEDDKLDDEELCFMHTRVLELVQTVHPSAYRDSSHGKEDIMNPARGVKFNYTDRLEPCWTGCIHENTQNFRAWIQGGEAWAACFSADCEGRPKLLGQLYEDPEYHLASAVHVEQQFIDLEEDPNSNRKLQEWLAGKYRVLNCRSNMGTGKTSMLGRLLDKYFQGATVLVVTYRRTLAANINGKLPGFVSYEDATMKPVPTAAAYMRSRFKKGPRNAMAAEWYNPLADRQKTPRVICQLDSLHRLAALREVPRFDLIILDEVESLLNHFSSATLASPATTAETLHSSMRLAKHVLAMDALWGLPTWTWFEKLKLPQTVIVNDFQPPQPRTFVFENHEASWMEGIKGDLRSERNVRPPPSLAEEGELLPSGVCKLASTEETSVFCLNITAASSVGAGRRRWWLSP